MTEANAEELLLYAKEHVTLQSVTLNKNVMINASLINEISEECRQNVLIKTKILEHLPPAEKIELYSARKSGYTNYDCAILKLAEQRLHHFDFIFKFIKSNQSCKQLSLTNLDLSRVQDQVRRGFDEIADVHLRNLRVLNIENIEFTEKPMRRMIKALRRMKDL
jgi:uncharacterized membrane protein